MDSKVTLTTFKMSFTKLIVKHFSYNNYKNFRFHLKNCPSPLFIFIRVAHTDIRVPDFGVYRKGSVRYPDVKTDISEDSRRGVVSFVMLAAGILGMYGMKAELHR